MKERGAAAAAVLCGWSTAAVLCGWSAADALDLCPQGPSATIESRSEIGGGFVYIQRMVLARDGGTGLEGRWIATSYEQVNLFPRAVPTSTLPQTTGSIPGFGRCTTDAPNQQTIRTLCDQAHAPFDARGGRIYETSTGRRVGALTTAGEETLLSLDLMAGTGSPHPPMTGPVQDGPQIQFDVALVSRLRHPIHDGVIVTMRITPRRPPPGMTGVSARLVSSGVSHPAQLDVASEGGTVIARVTLLGDARERARAAGAATLIAEASTGGCAYEREWSLDGLLLALGAAP